MKIGDDSGPQIQETIAKNKYLCLWCCRAQDKLAFQALCPSEAMTGKLATELGLLLHFLLPIFSLLLENSHEYLELFC